jgi:hypothetical protein
VITRSGTNRLKGTAWIYDSDSKWRARNFFQAPTGYSTWEDCDAADKDARSPKNNPETLYQFGANLGGPIIKDKLFFFVNRATGTWILACSRRSSCRGAASSSSAWRR